MRKLRWLGRVVQKTTNGVSAIGQRLVKDWVLGSYQAGSTILSRVARALHADKAGFEATLERLSRGMKHQGKAIGQVCEQYLRDATGAVRHKGLKVVAIDLSEIVKPHGKKMPFLCKVRDGSKSSKVRTVIEKGWWTIEIVASGWDHVVVPLLRRVYSTEHPTFRSVQHELRQALEQVVRRLGPGLWAVLDRGFDGVKYFGVLDDFFPNWAVRQRGDRGVYLPGHAEPVRLSTVAQAVRKDQVARPRVVRKDKLVRVEMRFGVGVIELADRSRRSGRRQMTLIAIQRDADELPLMLLVSRPVRGTSTARRWVEAYYRRWGVEEQTRAAKQLGGLEHLRVLSWESIQNLVALSVVPEGLLALQQLLAPRRAKRLARLAPIDSDAPPFALYRIWLSVALLLQGRRLAR
jgi:hypothetical protein